MTPSKPPIRVFVEGIGWVEGHVVEGEMPSKEIFDQMAMKRGQWRIVEWRRKRRQEISRISQDIGLYMGLFGHPPGAHTMEDISKRARLDIWGTVDIPPYPWSEKKVPWTA